MIQSNQLRLGIIPLFGKGLYTGRSASGLLVIIHVNFDNFFHIISSFFGGGMHEEEEINAPLQSVTCNLRDNIAGR